MDFVLVMRKKTTFEDSDQTWEEIVRVLSTDVAKIKKYQEKKLATLLEREIEFGEKCGISASPTLVTSDFATRAKRIPEAYKEVFSSDSSNSPQECLKKLEDTFSFSQGAAKTSKKLFV